MRIIKDVEELKDCFRDFEQDKVFFDKNMQFPLALETTFSWVDPSGHRAYLIYAGWAEQRPIGVVFRRSSPSPEASPKMCDWCHKVQAGDQVGLLSAATGLNSTVGLYLCRDLSCSEKVVSEPGLHDMRETIGQQTKLDHLNHRIRSFIRRNIV